MASPTIVSVSPASGATGVPTNVSISVIFDQEVDTSRLKNGGIFLEGPDDSKTIGPSNIHKDPADTDEDSFLRSPGLMGIKPTSFTFDRVDGSGVSVPYYDYGDTGDAGAIYRTKVTITPDRPLAALTAYTVYIVGDEDLTDSYDFGLSTRSVYDTRMGGNLGNGEVVFYGGYVGAVRQQFLLEITTAGASGTAEYNWYTSTDATIRSARTSPSYRILKDGVKVQFRPGLTFEVGDTFSVWCDIPEYMDGVSKYSFTTSSYEAETVPVSSSTLSGTGTTTSSSSLSVSSTVPEDRQDFVAITTTGITITFSASVDSATITDSTVTITGHAADGSLTGTPVYTEIITKSLSVSDTVLTITLDADQLYLNNIVVVSLDETVADTDGNTLGVDTEFYFGTTLTPFYAGVRHVRLRLGAIGNYFPDETVSLAIWDASREVDAILAPSTILDTIAYNRARQQWVVCFAAWVLVSSSGSITGSVRKRLGDFDVSRSEGSGSAGLDDTLRDCVNHYQALIEGGGDFAGTLSAPQRVVKGDYNVDEPNYGRGWDMPTQPFPFVNNKVLYSGERRWHKTFLRRRMSTFRRY